MNKLFSFIFLFSTNIFSQELAQPKSCDIKTFSQIIFTQNKTSLDLEKEIIKESNCEPATRKAFLSLITTIRGDVRAEHLSTLLTEQGIEQEVNLEPSKISLSTLENVIQSKSILNSGFELTEIQFVGLEGALTLNEQERIKVDCSQCELLGTQNLRISVVNPILNDNRVFWAKSQISKKIKVWKVRDDLSSLTEGNISSQLTLEEIAVTRPENYLNETQDLKFFKLNKSLRRGDIVKQSDVSPIVLIKSGNRVKIKIDNKNLNLVSTGLANKSAIFGDSIELTNLNSKKKIVGRVTDYNTVVIDL